MASNLNLNQEINSVDPTFIVPNEFRERLVRAEADDERWGEITLTRTQKVLRKTLEYAGPVGDVIETYNNWINKILPRQLSSRVIKDGEDIIRVSGIRHVMPCTTNSSGNSIPLTPFMCRENGLNYSAFIYVNLERIRRATPDVPEHVVDRASDVYLGKIPVMLGSDWCHLKGKTDQERLKMGECPSDPLGYFIIKGSERLIMIQERLRLNRIFLILDKNKKQICRITCPTIQGTDIVTLFNGNNGIQLSLGFFGWKNGDNPNTIPVFSIFKLLGETYPTSGLDNINVMAAMVLRYVKPEHHRRVWGALQKSFVAAAALADPIGKIAEMNETVPLQPTETGKNVLSNAQRQELYEKLLRSLFPHMNNDTMTQKLEMLCVMIAKYITHLIGFRPLDSRDSWSNKRLMTAGQCMEQLFVPLFKKFVKKAEESLAKSKRQQPLADIQKSFDSTILDEEFAGAFDSNNWGVKGSYSKENITDGVRRDSVLVTMAQMQKINTPTSRRVKSAKIRMVQLSQVGYVCLVETPEGETCGLVKAKAVGCYISVERNEDRVRSEILKYLVQNYTPETPYVCIINGRWAGWCDGPSTRQRILEFRRQFGEFRDISAVVDDNIIYVNCEGGRPTRPLLVVNQDTHTAIITEKKLWNAPFSELLQKGAIEYIDAHEQETIMLATTIESLEFWKQELTQMQVTVRNQRLRLQEIESAVDANGNLDFSILPQTVIIFNEKDGIPVQAVDPSSGMPLLTNDGTEIVDEEGTQLYDQDGDPIRSVYPAKEPLLPDLNYASLNSLSVKDITSLYYNMLNEARNDVTNTEDAISKHYATGSYTHCEIDPNAILGISASIIPLPNHNPGPRNTYQCSMGKQALGINHSNNHLRWETTLKSMAYPTRPIFEPQMNELLGLNQKPAGQNVVVAIMSLLGYNQEDAVIFNKASVDRGMFHMMITKVYKTLEKNSGNITESIGKPPLRQGENPNKYEHLDENGIAKIGSDITEGMVIIGKIRRNKETGEVEYPNVIAGIGEDGKVDSFINTKNNKGFRLVKVKLRKYSRPVAGDKFASRHAQKNTTAIIMNEEDMPFTANGMKPDLIINPNCIPSRMTIGKLIEIVVSKVGALRGERINASAFDNFDISKFETALHHLGYQSKGYERMYSGFTGNMIPAMIFIGPCYYQGLRHLVKGKIQARGRGALKSTTHQPVEGRHRQGGLRFGEMERDALIAHGADGVLRERMCYSSDMYRNIVCAACGIAATSNVATNVRVCPKCKSSDSLGRCVTPFAFNHLVNLLRGMGIDIRMKYRRLTENELLVSTIPGSMQ